MHNTVEELFDNLWEQYTRTSPVVKVIHDEIATKGNQVTNDHVALRTFNVSPFGIDSLAKEFLKLGYKESGSYTFEKKKLNAKHYEHVDPDKPKVFISELMVEQFSKNLQNIVKNLAESANAELLRSPQLAYSGPIWPTISYKQYQELCEESEYAAWLSVFGFCANHFTVFINKLSTFSDITKLNSFLKANGHDLNSQGGEIKGSPEVYLEQSSTMADNCEVNFSDEKHQVPSVYYEFAKRYPDTTGKIYQGFVAQSADKIFESTNKKND